jgi:hypothetical protein
MIATGSKNAAEPVIIRNPKECFLKTAVQHPGASDLTELPLWSPFRHQVRVALPGENNFYR